MNVPSEEGKQVSNIFNKENLTISVFIEYIVTIEVLNCGNFSIYYSNERKINQRIRKEIFIKESKLTYITLI